MRDLQIAEEDYPKLPIYRPKGVWLEERGGARDYALSWAYDHYSSSTENTRKFMVNAVAAVFDYDLIQYCCEKCANGGPCLNCGNWKVVQGPMPEVENPEIAKLITRDGMRCAISIIVSTKADFWWSGTTFVEEETMAEYGALIKVKVLQNHSKRMLEDLFPKWSMADAIEPVVTAGMWASTRHIFKLVGGAPVPDCVPVWDDVGVKFKFVCGGELKKGFLTFPAGTEELLEFYMAAKELLKSPMALYFPEVNDLNNILVDVNEVKANVIGYHKEAESLGVQPLKPSNFLTNRGRLGAFKSAQLRASGKELSSPWMDIEAENDYDKEYADIVEAYFGLKTTYKETACILLKARPRSSMETLSNVLDTFRISLSTEQSAIFEQK